MPFSIALGALFSAACLIEVFGVYAATSVCTMAFAPRSLHLTPRPSAQQRLPLVRMYTFGTIAASLIVIGAQIIIIVTDFLYKVRLTS